MTKSDVKLCNLCTKVMSKELFTKNRNTCKTCFSQHNKLKYEEKKKLLDKALEIQQKSVAVGDITSEYIALQEKYAKLEEKLTKLTNGIDEEELMKITAENKKLKEILSQVHQVVKPYVKPE